MKGIWPAALLALLVACGGDDEPAGPSVAFDEFFTDETMRIDYFHAGDADRENVSLDRVRVYGTWAGSVRNLVDALDYGGYYHKVYDAATGQLIYSRGFDSYFKEYQTSGPARDGVVRTFHESAIVPCPRKAVVFALDKRRPEGGFREVYRTEIDPGDVMVIRGESRDPAVRVFRSLDNGDPHTHADIAIVAEGYTKDERGKFEKDLKRFTKVFFRAEPCRSAKKRFNVYGVFKPSVDSGIDEPRHGSFRNSAVGATFNSMGSERYILTEDNRALRDIAGHVPYDALYIMINHERYGGGGIYNFYCTFTADNQWSEYLMVHEFGHSFFGLADEYYTSDTAYEDFYAKGYEPSEPNITALLDPENVKWKHLLSRGVEVPTPWEKADFDTLDLEWQRIRRELNDRIATMRREGQDEDEIRDLEEEYERLDRDYAERKQDYLDDSRFEGKVGVFEGAGYASSGLYRSMVDCIMFTKGNPEFCRVCREAMERVIDWYAQ